MSGPVAGAEGTKWIWLPPPRSLESRVQCTLLTSTLWGSWSFLGLVSASPGEADIVPTRLVLLLPSHPAWLAGAGRARAQGEGGIQS